MARVTWTPDAINEIVSNAMWGVFGILLVYWIFFRRGE